MDGLIAVTAFLPGANETMQIYGPFRLTTTQATGATPAPAKPSRLASSNGTSDPAKIDQLDLSSAAASTNRLDANTAIAGGGEIRIDRVAEIRRQIADGSYETPEKLDAALDNFLDRLA
ncbi:MAG: flagellar biosynthesis anti-sigma factor FlgM [Planctomycetota bacterium]